MGTVILHGTVVSGVGEGATFTQLDWVKASFETLLGFVPFPGTLNVRLEPSGVAAWKAYRETNGRRVEPASPEFCEARLYPALIVARDGRQADQVAIVWPLVAGYPDDVLEFVAPVRLRDVLSLQDGDQLTIRLPS